jgi:hypothetical protein
MTEEKLDDIGAGLETKSEKFLYLLALSVGWQEVELTVVQSYGLTKLQLYITFCLYIVKQKSDTLGGFRNRYSMDGHRWAIHTRNQMHAIRFM